MTNMMENCEFFLKKVIIISICLYWSISSVNANLVLEPTCIVETSQDASPEYYVEEKEITVINTLESNENRHEAFSKNEFCDASSDKSDICAETSDSADDNQLENEEEIELARRNLLNKLLNNNELSGKLINHQDITNLLYADNSKYDYIIISDDKRIWLLNDKYYDILLGKDNYTPESIKDILDKNSQIPLEYKDFISEYVLEMVEYYGDFDLRILANHLKDMSIKLEDIETIYKSVKGASAYYDAIENEMILRNDIDITNEKGRLVLRHELGHAAKEFNVFVDDYTITNYTNFYNHGIHIKEAMNVVFTTNPYIDSFSDYEIKNTGYQTISNIMRMLTKITDYDFENYISDNVHDLEYKLDAYFDSKYDFCTLFREMDELPLDFGMTEFIKDTKRIEYIYTEVTNMYIDSLLMKGIPQDKVLEYKDELIAELLQKYQSEEVVKVVDEAFAGYQLQN